MTAATYSGHWACRVPSDCSAVKSGRSAELSQGRPSSVAPSRPRAAFTGCELAVSTLNGPSMNNFRAVVHEDGLSLLYVTNKLTDLI